MTTKKIKITGLVASARRYNRLRFEIVEDDGSTTQVVYPRTRDGDDSLAVENGIFTVAQAIYFSASSPDQRLAMAELYVNNQCCCCTKTHVEGVLALSPVDGTSGNGNGGNGNGGNGNGGSGNGGNGNGGNGGNGNGGNGS